jgi:ornithine carbamoyltransferase
MLGGHGLMLGPQDIQLGVNETMKDTSLVLCRFNDLILARVFAHADVEELARHSTVPGTVFAFVLFEVSAIRSP